MEKTHADRDPHPRPAPPRALERSGSFVWFELRARDPQKAAALFQHVVGCKLGEMPMGNTTYTLLEADQRWAAWSPSRREGRAGVHLLRVGGRLDATAERVREAGGEVLEEKTTCPVHTATTVRVRDGERPVSATTPAPG